MSDGSGSAEAAGSNIAGGATAEEDDDEVVFDEELEEEATSGGSTANVPGTDAAAKRRKSLENQTKEGKRGELMNVGVGCYTEERD